MAELTLTAPTEHVARIRAAYEGLYPQWLPEDPSEWSTAKVIETVLRKLILRDVRRAEQKAATAAHVATIVEDPEVVDPVPDGD